MESDKEINPDYEFEILKTIDEDGNMSLPQHTGNTQTKIDVLPGYNDLQKEKQWKKKKR